MSASFRDQRLGEGGHLRRRLGCVRKGEEDGAEVMKHAEQHEAAEWHRS